MDKIDQEFSNWLSYNRYGNYKGMQITPQTELVAYTYVISAFVVTFRHSTRYYFKEVEREKAIAAKILCTLCNLTMGWWGLPWGPIWTIKETVVNLSDGNVKRWGEIAGTPVEPTV